MKQELIKKVATLRQQNEISLAAYLELNEFLEEAEPEKKQLEKLTFPYPDFSFVAIDSYGRYCDLMGDPDKHGNVAVMREGEWNIIRMDSLVVAPLTTKAIVFRDSRDGMLRIVESPNYNIEQAKEHYGNVEEVELKLGILGTFKNQTT